MGVPNNGVDSRDADNLSCDTETLSRDTDLSRDIDSLSCDLALVGDGTSMQPDLFNTDSTSSSDVSMVILVMVSIVV